jgi:hypothetical protein
MVHSFCQARFLPKPASADGAFKGLLSLALAVALVPAAAVDSPQPVGKAADAVVSPATLTSLRVDDLIAHEKRAREQQSRQRLLPPPSNTGAMGSGAAKTASKVMAQPVLWSLTGLRGNYLAEVFWGNKLITIESDQSHVPQLGVLEYIDETGVYIRPERKHKLKKSWLDSEGMLVLLAPRDGQAAPTLVDIPKAATALPLGLGLGSANSAIASNLPMFTPQPLSNMAPAPTVTLGSGVSTLQSQDGNSSKKMEFGTTVNPATSTMGKDAAPLQDKKK